MSKKRKRKEAEARAAEEAEFKEKLDALTPEQAEMFVQALELAMRKRRVILIGYLAAILAVVIGMVWALYAYGKAPEGTFMGWVFLVPFFCAAVLAIGFGKIARALKPRPVTPPADGAPGANGDKPSKSGD